MKRPDWVIWGLRGILLLEFLYIFFFLLNYYFSFMNAENFVTHGWILSEGKGFRWDDFVKSLNVDLIELHPHRISRPISDLFLVINAKFRANLWDFFPPHPSLSIHWPLSFLLLPFFLYKFFRNMGCPAAVALAGTGLYLSSLGFLTPIVMLFHPGKSLVNFLAVLSLFFGSEIYKRSVNLPGGRSVKDIAGFWPYFMALLCSLFLGFFCDETGLFVYAMVAVIFYPIFFRFKERLWVLGAFLSLPVGYLLSLTVGLPYLHFALRGRAVNFFECALRSRPSDLTWKTILDNFVYLFCDHPHMQLNISQLLPYNPRLFFLQLIYTLIMCFIIFLFVAAVFEGHAWKRIRPVALCGGLLILFVFFHVFLMARFDSSWGIAYYGSLFSLVYFMTVTFIMQFIMEGQAEGLFRRLLVFFVFIMTLHGLVFAVYRVNIFWREVAGGPYSKDDIFKGKLGPYYKSLAWGDIQEKSKCRRLYTVLSWSTAKEKKIVPPIPREQIDYCKEIMKKDSSFIKDARYLSVELPIP
ncbi:MAG: hypothetical protein WC552_01625 [Candidatus Omnitrophota bacterium]